MRAMTKGRIVATRRTRDERPGAKYWSCAVSWIDLRRDEELGDAAHVSELTEVGIELRIGSQASIVLGDFVLGRGAPNTGDDELLFGVDLRR